MRLGEHQAQVVLQQVLQVLPPHHAVPIAVRVPEGPLQPAQLVERHARQLPQHRLHHRRLLGRQHGLHVRRRGNDVIQTLGGRLVQQLGVALQDDALALHA